MRSGLSRITRSSPSTRSSVWRERIGKGERQIPAVRAPDGTLLGKIRVPEAVANLCFGGAKLNRLFICATTSLYAVYVNSRAAPRGRGL